MDMFPTNFGGGPNPAQNYDSLYGIIRDGLEA